uniref:Reverse transcriptase domain-containing protein n=1 Tax=Schistosoma curassoni TaxID=6186 RepID=A0A183JBY9_9TREM
MAIRQIKNGKAAGPGNKPADTLNSDTDVNANMLHVLFRKIWEEEQIPTQWKYPINIPKNGDLSKCENYTGITLISVPENVLNKVLLNRMKDVEDISIRGQQAGFHKDRSYTDQITTIRIIAKQLIEWNPSLYIKFLVYEKAFDSMDRRFLWKHLRHYGVCS